MSARGTSSASDRVVVNRVSSPCAEGSCGDIGLSNPALAIGLVRASCALESWSCDEGVGFG